MNTPYLFDPLYKPPSTTTTPSTSPFWPSPAHVSPVFPHRVMPSEAEQLLLKELYRAAAQAHAENGAIKAHVQLFGCDIILMKAPSP